MSKSLGSWAASAPFTDSHNYRTTVSDYRSLPKKYEQESFMKKSGNVKKILEKR